MGSEGVLSIEELASGERMQIASLIAQKILPPETKVPKKLCNPLKRSKIKATED